MLSLKFIGLIKIGVNAMMDQEGNCPLIVINGELLYMLTLEMLAGF